MTPRTRGRLRPMRRLTMERAIPRLIAYHEIGDWSSIEKLGVWLTYHAMAMREGEERQKKMAQQEGV